jgi:uncharacterized membrane protein HdeD (DUF308 family)
MVRAIFGIVRVFVGLLGVAWVVGGLYGVVYAGSDRAWGPAVSALLAALVGFCLAYSAFVRAPWERQAGTDERAS